MLKNKCKTFIAPGLLGPLGKNTNLATLGFQAKALDQFFKTAISSNFQQAVYCHEQFILNPEQTVAGQKALKDITPCNDCDYYHIDFVHLNIELTHIRMNRIIIPHKNEVKALCAELNQWYQHKDWSFILSQQGNVYLQIPKTHHIATYPTNYVIGRDIKHFIPYSRQEDWAKILNEIQMILFQSPINEQRKRQHKLPVNSIWIWGEQKGIAEVSIQKDDDYLLVTALEDALLQQDAQRWLEEVKKLDQLLAETLKQYPQINLIADYQSIYYWKKPFFYPLSNILQFSKGHFDQLLQTKNIAT